MQHQSRYRNVRYLKQLSAICQMFFRRIPRTAHDSIILHLLKVHAGENISATSGGNENLAFLGSFLHRGDLISRNSSLQGINRVNFRNNYPCTHAMQRLRASFSNIAEPSDDCHLSSNHHICGTLDPIDQRLSAPIKVVEFRFGNRIVDVDCRY